jgi:ribonucleoside-diphosphate reductase alpha chain
MEPITFINSYTLDPSQAAMKLGTGISRDVWELKYRRENEEGVVDTIHRVVRGVLGENHPERILTEDLVLDGIFLPGGRILAGAGLPHHDSTLMNCYVMGVLDDSLKGIMECLRESALTAKFGGGIGVDFSPLRPKSAPISTAAYFAGGPVAFMALWDAMGHAMEAGGNRRGGKMGVLHVSHPDILDFIDAKTKAGKLTGFNISVLVTDAFMEAVRGDSWWYLTHSAAPREIVSFEEAPSVEGHIWGRIKARDLWARILRSTYEYSEPGVIFIDRMNAWNPLYYRETIYATNPCGEQPLPPYGACNLGSINLARLVKRPFKDDACIDKNLLITAVRAAIIFLDKVLDVTKYPLEAQKEEAQRVRRIGLGITGLADMFAQLDVPYGSPRAAQIAAYIMRTITNTAYVTSSHLAATLGSFPDFNYTQWREGIFVSRLNQEVHDLISAQGLRNGVLLSIAPTGTISTVFGDVSGGCEPHFSHEVKRKVKVKDASHNDTNATYSTYSYAVRMLAQVANVSLEDACAHIEEDPARWPTAQNLTVEAHQEIQGALQYWTDSSISKTTNVPEDISFEAFADVYMGAYQKGCKGCTTYRPSAVRDSVLEVAKPKEGQKPSEEATSYLKDHVFVPINGERGSVLDGKTYKLRWPDLPNPIFVTINHDERGPIELFINSRNSLHNEWTVAVSVLVSKLLQAGYPLAKVAEHLQSINLSTSTAYDNGRHYASLVSRIGHLLADHKWHDVEREMISGTPMLEAAFKVERKPTCSFCASQNVRMVEGCIKCDDCGQSKCS